MQIDIEGRQSVEARLLGGQRLLEMIAVGLPLPAVLNEMRQLVEKLVSGCRCGISLTDPDTMRSLRVGAPSLMHGDTEANVDLVCAELRSYDRASSRSAPIIVPDIASDTRWPQAWRERSVAAGRRACWVTPILSRTHDVLGNLALYSPVPGQPDPFQRDVMAEFAHIVSVAMERARIDRSLGRSEACFRAIVETTPECVKVITRDGTLLRVNSAGSTLAGTGDPAALIGACFYDFVAAEHRDRYVEFNREICSGKTGFLEFDIVTLNGERRHMETHAAPLQHSDGSIVQLGVTRDITARRQAAEQLWKSAALMAKVEQISLSGSFCWRPSTGGISCSEQIYRIYEIEPGTKITMDLIVARVHPDDRHIVDNALEHAHDAEDMECDYRLLLPDGSIRYVRMQAHATFGAHGHLDYIGAVQDVTERRQSEDAVYGLRAELAHVSRVNGLGALSASIAHEINQPLAGILTNARLLVRLLGAQPPNIDAALETAQRTIRDGQRASEVVTRLRAMFRKDVALTDAVDLGEAVHEVIELLRSEIRRKRIVLHLKIAGDLPPVTGDRIQLQQVVLNLLLNAVEAMQGVGERPRRILVRIDRDGAGHLCVSVIDTGTGFDPQDAARLFDAFYTSKREGMGIGLSVSRHIVERHGGRIWATSNEGSGATFAFSLPCRAASVMEQNRAAVQLQDACAGCE